VASRGFRHLSAWQSPLHAVGDRFDELALQHIDLIAKASELH
jgi:hypothetical protein